MNKLQKIAVITKLVDSLHENGSWCGEAHIQKALFLAQEIAGIPTGFEFILYKHGPFSFDFRDELGSMLADQLLDYKSNQYPYGPSIVITENAVNIQSKFTKTLSDYIDEIEFITEKIGKKNVVELERIGTAMLVIIEHSELSKDHKKEKLRELKPHIKKDEAEKTFIELSSILDEYKIKYAL